jgi:outer membrane protein
MQKTLITLALIASLGAPQGAAAQDTGTWLVRARAVHLASSNTDNTGLGLTINDRWLPEVDVSYFFSPQVAAELVLTYPQKQTVYAGGADIGSFKHLPPTLTAQYHWAGLGNVRPYVGAGLNYTHLSDVHVLNGGANLKRNSFGLALQAGLDVPVGGGWLLNLDVKKVQIATDVLVGATEANAGSFKVDPVLFSVGFGKRF